MMKKVIKINWINLIIVLHITNKMIYYFILSHYWSVVNDTLLMIKQI